MCFILPSTKNTLTEWGTPSTFSIPIPPMELYQRPPFFQGGGISYWIQRIHVINGHWLPRGKAENCPSHQMVRWYQTTRGIESLMWYHPSQTHIKPHHIWYKDPNKRDLVSWCMPLIKSVALEILPRLPSSLDPVGVKWELPTVTVIVV